MRIYLEAAEKVGPYEVAEFVRLDVTENTEAERASILAELKVIMPNAVYSRHLCRHDVGQACHSQTL